MIVQKNFYKRSASEILEIDKNVYNEMNSKKFPVDYFGVPLAGSLIPWIDSKIR